MENRVGGIRMDILPEIRNRLSPVIFEEKSVEKEKMDALIEAARWAPSCMNNQSWTYVFVDREASTRSDLEDGLSRSNSWARKAPYLVAVGAVPEEACQANNLPYYAYDCALSVMSLVIEAEHQGLRVHQMAGWDESKVRRALGFPDKYRIVVVFALGYEEDPTNIWNRLDDRMREKVKRDRTRKPSTDNFFFESFGKA